MNWVCIGLLAGSLITSLHDTREACEGRAVVLREAKALAKCTEMPRNWSGTTSNYILLPGSSSTGAQGQ